MQELLDQIRMAVRNGSHLLGLYSALSIPDICGALESKNGRASGAKYETWFNRWVHDKYHGKLTGAQCYSFRCGIIHQGRSTHSKMGYTRIMFTEPKEDAPTIHATQINDVLFIDIETFCEDIVSSAERWLEEVKHQPNFQHNFQHLLTKYPAGIAPYVVGCAVYA